MVDAVKTQGTTIYMSTEVGSPQTFLQLANVTDISRSGPQRKIIDTTNLSSVAATKISGLLDEGEATFSVNVDPGAASFVALQAALSDGLAHEFKIVLTDSGAAEFHFFGIVSSFNFDIPADDKVTAKMVVAITGASWIVY